MGLLQMNQNVPEACKTFMNENAIKAKVKEIGYPYSLRMRENMDQKKLRIWTLFMQCFKWGRKKVSMLLYKIIFF